MDTIALWYSVYTVGYMIGVAIPTKKPVIPTKRSDFFVRGMYILLQTLAIYNLVLFYGFTRELWLYSSLTLVLIIQVGIGAFKQVRGNPTVITHIFVWVRMIHLVATSVFLVYLSR